MPRVKGGPGHARKRKRVLKRASGFVASPGVQYRSAKEFIRRADRYAYRDRRQKKRHFRTLWVVRLNAALKQRGISYNRFIPALLAAGIELNRKMLSDLGATDPAAFDAVVNLVRPHLERLLEAAKAPATGEAAAGEPAAVGAVAGATA